MSFFMKTVFTQTLTSFRSGGIDNNGFNESLNSATGTQFGSSLGLYTGYRTASPVNSTYASNRHKPAHHPFCLKHNRRSASPVSVLDIY